VQVIGEVNAGRSRSTHATLFVILESLEKAAQHLNNAMARIISSCRLHLRVTPSGSIQQNMHHSSFNLPKHADGEVVHEEREQPV